MNTREITVSINNCFFLPNRYFQIGRLGLKRIAIAVLLAIAFAATTAPLDAQQNSGSLKYKVIDLGTFGGANSAETVEFPFVTNRGQVVGFADTATPDPTCFSPECLISHAFRWDHGVMTDLGTLPGPNNNSFAVWANDIGEVVGQSTTLDSASGRMSARATLWNKDNNINDLGVLRGGDFSLAVDINARGIIVGVSTNGIPDELLAPFPFLSSFGQQLRSFVWQNGTMTDLGTLGGPDTVVGFINDSGQIAGNSYTSSIIVPETGQPPQHAFLWEDGVMHDLGTLGGTLTLVSYLNNRGDVIGSSTLVGDANLHPVLWTGNNVIDLGTLGGTAGHAIALNDSGEIAGWSSVANERHHAFFWKNGVMSDLGTIASDRFSVAHAINARGQVVGTSGSNGQEVHGFLSQQGAPMIDLNAFVPPGMELTITDGEWINDRGEIAASGMLPNGDFHAVLLVPCDNPEADSGCRQYLESAATQTSVDSANQAVAETAIDKVQSLQTILQEAASRRHGFLKLSHRK